MDEVQSIEDASFEWPWFSDDFTRILRHPAVIGMVAVIDDQVVGFMIYELQKQSLEIKNFAVHPSHRRQGVGRAMIEKLKSKLYHGRRTRLFINLSERSSDGHAFLRRMGFLAVGIVRQPYECTTDDAYRFCYVIRKPVLQEQG